MDSTNAGARRPNDDVSAQAGEISCDQCTTAVAQLLAELRQLSSDRDDGTATAALALLEDLERLGPRPTPHAFQSFYLRLFTRRRRALGTPMAAEWKRVHVLGADVLTASVQAWRREVLSGDERPLAGRRVARPITPDRCDESCGPVPPESRV